MKPTFSELTKAALCVAVFLAGAQFGRIGMFGALCGLLLFSSVVMAKLDALALAVWLRISCARLQSPRKQAARASSRAEARRQREWRQYDEGERLRRIVDTDEPALLRALGVIATKKEVR